jgi:type II secretion system protein J
VKIETNSAGGFTLIEMILAIGVAAIVLAAANAVFFTALHLRNETSDIVDAASPLDQSLAVLRHDLQCAVTPKTSGVLSGDFKIGNVTSTGISDPVAAEIYTATGALSATKPWGDIQRVTYELKNSTGTAGRDLYRSVTRNLLTTATPDVEDQLMIRSVDSVQFSAYDGMQWNNAWDTTDTTSVNTNLPLAVRVDIQLNGGRGRNMPPIEILVPIDSQSRSNSTSTVGS